jgi:hypothetical protein
VMSKRFCTPRTLSFPPDDRPKGWAYLVEGARIKARSANTLRTWRSPAANQVPRNGSTRSEASRWRLH